jgi:radical SAM superfamily enzyme YgiQ (UPF0313 family)
MPAIVLATLNAKWIHASFGLRCLLANMGELRGETALVEATIHDRAVDVAERILAHEPRIVGLGVYVWNARETELLVATLRRVAPKIAIVLGGPEISHETDEQRVSSLADLVIRGEGDLAFADACRKLLAGEPPAERVISPSLPDLGALRSPYSEYTDDDLRHRVVYVEASRGCPFACEFCLSALDEKVREFPLEPFLGELDRLLARGALQFKFVDRTFNLSRAMSSAILEFFLARMRPGLFLHFEMIPDRLPEELKTLLARFPPGTVQLEIGIQTFDAATARRISRVQHAEKIEKNLAFLRDETSVHLHTDLIAGLPGEDIASFARGFDRLIGLRPHEIQVGMLKRLRGTPIVRHDAEHEMIYAEHAPYEVLATRVIPFAEMQRLRRFARTGDLIGNSGRFARTTPLLWRASSPFEAVMRFSDALHAKLGALHGIASVKLARELFDHLVADGCPRNVAGRALLADARNDPSLRGAPFLREFADDEAPVAPTPRSMRPAATRQARHQA